MLVILSPSKNQDFGFQPQTKVFTQAQFAAESRELVEQLRGFSPAQLQELMNINPKLAELNATRFLEWSMPFTIEKARQALLAFKGEVFNGLQAHSLSEEDLLFAQGHLRLLSGLHGVLRPLDLIMPYRLEMGTKMKNSKGENLYDFWSNKITEAIGDALRKSGSRTIINLASKEYFKTINTKNLDADIITPVFKDYKNGSYKFITIYGKNARGMMARFIIQNKTSKAESLKLFDEKGYYYNEGMSKEGSPVFTRG